MEDDKKMISIEEAEKVIKFQKEYYEKKLKEKPSAIQIIAFGVSCFTLGVSLAKLWLK